MFLVGKRSNEIRPLRHIFLFSKVKFQQMIRRKYDEYNEAMGQLYSFVTFLDLMLHRKGKLLDPNGRVKFPSRLTVFDLA